MQTQEDRRNPASLLFAFGDARLPKTLVHTERHTPSRALGV